jgi:hypothetical protein
VSLSPEHAAAYLAAIIDGEGHVGRYDPNHLSARRVVITNTDMDIIEACRVALNVLGIAFGEHSCDPRPGRWKQVHHITILRGSEIAKLRDVPIQSSRKRERLEEICNSYGEPFQIDREMVVRLYVEEQRYITEIGAALNCSQTPIRRILIEEGIPRRGQGWRRAA